MSLTEALRVLHDQGRLAAPCLPGMLVDRPKFGVRTRLGADSSGLLGDPDLSDPATVGCLLALLREASGHRGLVALLACETTGGTWDVVWHDRALGLCDLGGPPVAAPTEGEAIASALIALAGVP